MISFNSIFLLTVFELIISLIRGFKSGDKNDVKIMSKDSTLALRGVAIIGILIHHCSQYFDSLGPFQFAIKQSGYALTAVFFLFSGYGCWYSLRKISGGGTTNRLSKTTKWALNHSLRIWFDFVIVFVLNVIVFKTFNVTDGMSAKELIKDFLTLTEPTWVSWYPKIQIACYVVLALAFLINEKRKEIITLTVTIVYIAFAYKFGLASMWYTSVICFPVGMLFAKYLNKYSIPKYKLMISSIVSVLSFGCLFYLQTIIYQSLLRLVSTLFLAVFIVSITGLFEFNSNLLKKIGNMSFEIYLIHLFLLRVAVENGYKANISILLIFVLSLFVSYPINKLVVMINKKIISK